MDGQAPFPERVPANANADAPDYELDRELSGATPVYRLRGSGPPAVPTGRLFVRFAEGVAAEERRAQLASAGVELEEVPAYASHAAWVRPPAGGIAAAVEALPRLAALEGVAAVEPQMLREARRR